MNKQTYELTPMRMEHYDAAYDLWRRSPGVSLHLHTDSPAAVLQYLLRNPGLSVLALADGQVIGTVLCGHDGRRGYLNHLAVADGWQRQGIGRAMVNHCMQRLVELGIERCHVLVYDSNPDAMVFWSRLGFQVRDDLELFTRHLIDHELSLPPAKE